MWRRGPSIPRPCGRAGRLSSACRTTPIKSRSIRTAPPPAACTAARFLAEKPPELKLFTNDAYHAGDDLELTVVDGTAVKNGRDGPAARLDRTVKVGAVIRKPPAWLDMGGGDMMSLIVGEGAEARLGLPVRFYELLTYLSGGEDYETAAASMRAAAR